MTGRPVKEPKRPHVKKPLNAFMLFMKEQRPKIAAEYTLKESAAINQILGKRVSVNLLHDRRQKSLLSYLPFSVSSALLVQTIMFI